MANILDLKSVKDGMTLSDCIVYLQSYKKLPKKDGKSFYIAGNFVNQEDSLSFKVWDADLVNALSENDISGSVVRISGSVSSYMNNLDVKINTIEPVSESECSKAQFMKSADVNTLFTEFQNFINAELSPNAIKVVTGIFKSENLFGRFKEEFAGSKMHDAQIGGLLNHTMKMLRIGKVVYDNEPRMWEIPDFKDAFFMAILFHDIGKIYEMNLGVYTDISFVTHRILGIEILVKYKSAIVQIFGMHFYYLLVSALQGHHGEFGDAPNSVLAYLVHLIDMVDSQTTGIFDKIERNEVNMSAGNTTIFENGKNLVL